MIKDGQVKELRRLLGLGRTLIFSARMTEMTNKTARNYRDDERLPSQRKKARDYRTRVDPFIEIWPDIQRKLEDEPALKAKTLFEWIQETHPGQFEDSTRRTFERRVLQWRSLHGPNKPVFFSQIHHAGRLAASDFTVCNTLGVTIARTPFDHTFFHCVLTYSNVESVSLCFSESFESLGDGIQKAFWEFGGVPQRHRSDSLTAAVRNHSEGRVFTNRYAALLDFYGCKGERTNARCANENGDVESQNGHLKDRIDQALLLRGSRDFASREEYVRFVEAIIVRANSHRASRFAEEKAQLRPLPTERLDTDDVVPGVSVRSSSTIQVRTNTYSVPSRLIGQRVDLRISAEHIVVTHHGHVIQTMPRLVGKHLAAINYRHIIDSLLRKPGAFANYQYREEMFPTSHFRMAWDLLRGAHAEKIADKMYVKILELAARESEQAVADALRLLINTSEAITVERVRELVTSANALPAVTDIQIDAPVLFEFDSLIPTFAKECLNYDENHKDDCYQINGRNEPSQSDPQNRVAEDCGIGDRSAESADGAVSRTPTAHHSGSVSGGGDASSDGESQSSGVPVRTGDSGMRNTPLRPHPATPDTIETSVWEDLGQLQIRSAASECDSATGDSSRRIVSDSPRKYFDFRQAGLGKKSCPLCAGRTTGSAGTQHPVHNLRTAGAATADREKGPASVEADQPAFEVRRADHRRPGLRPAEPRGDGSAVYTVGRTLRTRQRAADEQSRFQQMGSDLQGHNDHCRCHRPIGTPQCHHRAQRPQLPCRNSAQVKIDWTATSNEIFNSCFLNGISNCR